jgi:hypothetical protein
MAFQLTRHLAISAPDALQRISSLGGVWREPEKDLATALEFVTSSRVRIRGQAFRISLDGIRSEGAIYPEIDGKVIETGSGTCTLTARVGGEALREWEAYVLFGILVVARFWGGWFWVAILGSSYAIRMLVVSGTDRGMSYAESPLARALADRLDRTFADVLTSDPPTTQAHVA